MPSVLRWIAATPRGAGREGHSQRAPAPAAGRGPQPQAIPRNYLSIRIMWIGTPVSVAGPSLTWLLAPPLVSPGTRTRPRDGQAPLP